MPTRTRVNRIITNLSATLIRLVHPSIHPPTHSLTHSLVHSSTYWSCIKGTISGGNWTGLVWSCGVRVRSSDRPMEEPPRVGGRTDASSHRRRITFARLARCILPPRPQPSQPLSCTWTLSRQSNPFRMLLSSSSEVVLDGVVSREKDGGDCFQRRANWKDQKLLFERRVPLVAAVENISSLIVREISDFDVRSVR